MANMGGQYIVEGKIIAPPLLGSNPTLKGQLVERLLTFLAPLDARRAYSREPRYYNLNPRGRNEFIEGVRDGRIQSGSVVSHYVPPDLPAIMAYALFDFSHEPGRDLAPEVQVKIVLDATDTLSMWANQMSALVTQTFPSLHTVVGTVDIRQAMVSHENSDLVGKMQYQRGRPILREWPDVRRYIQDVYWGNGLGIDLCDRLGGTERILREAPVAIARPLSEGVWLQVSTSPPAGPAQLDPLRRFLAPLLEWTIDDVNRGYQTAIENAMWYGLTGVEESRKPIRRNIGRKRHLIPMKVLQDTIEGPDIGLNLYLAAAPTPDQASAVTDAVDNWYREGFAGGFGAEGFHSMTRPAIDGSVMRWRVDLGSAQWERAISALREHLGALTEVEVTELVIGFEEIG